MEFLKGILIDGLNGFSLKFIPFFMFQILSAALMGHVLHLAARRKFQTNEHQGFALLAGMICVLVSVAKYSLPFSVLAAAVILLLLKSPERNRINTVLLLTAGTIGVGCGVGSVIQTVLGFTVGLFILLFLPLKKEE